MVRTFDSKDVVTIEFAPTKVRSDLAATSPVSRQMLEKASAAREARLLHHG